MHITRRTQMTHSMIICTGRHDLDRLTGRGAGWLTWWLRQAEVVISWLLSCDRHPLNKGCKNQKCNFFQITLTLAIFNLQFWFQYHWICLVNAIPTISITYFYDYWFQSYSGQCNVRKAGNSSCKLWCKNYNKCLKKV